mgnify:CR=1 FL=1
MGPILICFGPVEPILQLSHGKKYSTYTKHGPRSNKAEQGMRERGSERTRGRWLRVLHTRNVFSDLLQASSYVRPARPMNETAICGHGCRRLAVWQAGSAAIAWNRQNRIPHPLFSASHPSHARESYPTLGRYSPCSRKYLTAARISKHAHPHHCHHHHHNYLSLQQTTLAPSKGNET